MSQGNFQGLPIVNLFGIDIDFRLRFENHISNICKTAAQLMSNCRDFQ